MIYQGGACSEARRGLPEGELAQDAPPAMPREGGRGRDDQGRGNIQKLKLRILTCRDGLKV